MKKTRIDLKLIVNDSCKKKCNKTDRREVTQNDLCTRTVSSIDNLPVRCVGEWAAEKIFHLIQYFSIFTIGMKSAWQGNINYIEICSGPGRCVSRETGNEFNGTSLSIIEHEARQYLNRALFFDYDPTVIEILNKRIALRNSPNAKAYFGDYNNPKEICKTIIKETNGYGLNLIFIDPTDCSVPFSLLEVLKTNIKNIDFIVNLAIRTDVNRNIRTAILNPDSHKSVIKKYSNFLGSSDFFNSPEAIKIATEGNQIKLRVLFRNAYMSNLRKLGYEHFDFKPIRNYYDLVFASSHERGIDFWQKANKISFTGQHSLF